VAAHGFAESREPRADVGVFAFHAEAGDELRGEGFFFHGEVASFEDLTGGFFPRDDFVERADDVAIFLDALLEKCGMAFIVCSRVIGTMSTLKSLVEMWFNS